MATAAATQGAEIRRLLRQGPRGARHLAQALGVSQPTISRALAALGPDVIRLGSGPAVQYALRDATRAPLVAPIFRVTADGQLRDLGTLIPVYPQGFVMAQSDGVLLHTEGLPWWLYDMRPQGYLGRAYNLRHGPALGLPARLSDWDDSHVLRALLDEGADLPGNLLVGEGARARFVHTPAVMPIAAAHKAEAYAALAAAAARGEHPGSSAGGEQPKFTAYAETEGDDAAHVLVKFTALADHAVSERWRDLLLAEHLALSVLRDNGVPAARSAIFNLGTQRFLEVCRFDRVAALGRRALHSIGALDHEFLGSAGDWPAVVRGLAASRHVDSTAVPVVELLWAFGTLIGNTDMHGGNLAFMAEHGRPYQLAPAYDMTPMAFAPTTGGDLPVRALSLRLGPEVPATAWHSALPLAQAFVHRLEAHPAISTGFTPCLEALRAHLDTAAEQVGRLG